MDQENKQTRGPEAAGCLLRQAPRQQTERGFRIAAQLGAKTFDAIALANQVNEESVSYGWPNRALYSGEEINDSTISAFTKLPPN